MHHVAIATALALSFIACGPPSGNDAGYPDAGSAEPSLEIGTGEGLYRPFADGETLDLVTGCQGSQHVWVALRTEGLDRRGPIIDVQLVRAEDDVVVSQTFVVRITFQPVEGEIYGELVGLTVVVPEPDQAIGHDLILRATVTDMNDIEVSAERPVRIDWGEGGCGEPLPG